MLMKHTAVVAINPLLSVVGHTHTHTHEHGTICCKLCRLLKLERDVSTLSHSSWRFRTSNRRYTYYMLPSNRPHDDIMQIFRPSKHARQCTQAGEGGGVQQQQCRDQPVCVVVVATLFINNNLFSCLVWFFVPTVLYNTTYLWEEHHWTSGLFDYAEIP